MYKIDLNENKQYFFYEIDKKNVEKRTSIQKEFLDKAWKVLSEGYDPKQNLFKDKMYEHKQVLSAVTVIKDELLQCERTKKPKHIFKLFLLIKKFFGFKSLESSNKKMIKQCHRIEAFTRKKFRKETNSVSNDQQYHELTRRLPEEALAQLKDFEIDPVGQELLLISLEKGDWKEIRQRVIHDGILAINILTYQALDLVKKGRVSVNQFSTLMFFLSACRLHGAENVKIIPLFKGEKINPKSDKLIAETAKDGRSHFPFLGFYQSSHLNLKKRLRKREIDVIYELMREAPRSEQYLFMIPDLSGHYSQVFKPISITQRIQLGLGLNEFGRIKRIRKGRHQRLISPVTLVQSLIDTTTPFQFQVNPVLGNSSFEDIKNNGINNCRDVQIPFAAVARGLIPDKADGFEVKDTYDMPEHDFYHCKRCAAIPPAHQRAFNHVSDLLSASLATIDKSDAFKENLESILIDMDFGQYKYGSENWVFWWTLLSKLSSLKAADREGECLKSFLKSLATDLETNHELWDSFGITKNSLNHVFKNHHKLELNTSIIKFFEAQF